MPPALPTSAVRLPRDPDAPERAVLRRMLLAAMVLLATVLVVYLDRGGYRDSTDGRVSLLDALYYSTVTLSTTGYGDVIPASDSARLVNVLVITPLRVLFLIILVGTTLEVLTERTREQWRLSQWRRKVHAHTIVVGYGTKGRSAARALVADGADPAQIVVIDPDPRQVEEANARGLAGIVGDATHREVLESAQAAEAARVIVAAQRDDTAVLVTLTVRQLNTAAPVIVAVREAENAPLLSQSGATSVVVSSEAAGRLLGVSAVSPATGMLFEDLLVPNKDLEMAERDVLPEEVGRSARDSRDLVIAVLRNGELHRFGTPAAERLAAGDRVVVVRHAGRP